MKLRWVLVGSAVSFIVTFIIVFITAVAEYFTGMSEATGNIFAYLSAALGVFIGALLAARRAGSAALLNAMPVALLYIAAMLAASLTLKGSINTDVHCISLMAGVIFAGFLGAVFGRS